LQGKTAGKARSLEAELYCWLQKLDPKSRRVILVRRFTEEQRLALERWILKQKVSHADRVERPCAAKVRLTATVKLGRCHSCRITGSSKKPAAAKKKAVSCGRGSAGAGWKQPQSGSPGVHACTKGGRLRYCATATVGPFLVTTRYLADLSQVRRFRAILSRMQARMASCADQPGLAERTFRAVLEEERSRSGQDLIHMDLRFSVTIMAKYWVGTALKTPQFLLASPEGLEAGLRAFRLLHQARNVVYKGKTNRYSILRWHSPEELDQAWNRIRRHYLAVWANAGFSLAKVSARLKALEDRHRPQRLRLVQRWKAKQGAVKKKRKSTLQASPPYCGNLATDGCTPSPESQILQLLASWNVQDTGWKQQAKIGVKKQVKTCALKRLQHRFSTSTLSCESAFFQRTNRTAVRSLRTFAWRFHPLWKSSPSLVGCQEGQCSMQSMQTES